MKAAQVFRFKPETREADRRSRPTRKLSIAYKLTIASLLMVTLTLLAGGTGLWQVITIGQAISDAREKEQQWAWSLELLASGHRLVAALDNMLLTEDPFLASTEVAVALGSISFYVETLQESGGEIEASGLLEEMQVTYDELRQAVSEVDKLARQELWTEASAEVEQKVRPANERMALLIRRLVRQADQDARAMTEHTQIVVQRAALLLAVIVGLTTAVAWGWRQVVFRGLSRSIDELRQGVSRISSGDLEYELDVQTGDEIQELSDEFNKMADELANVIGSLEQRVADRTRGLQTATEVSRAITSVLDPKELLDLVVNLARERFNLYYVGLFLVDAAGAGTGGRPPSEQFAVLRAGTGEAGQKMLELGHKLGVGSKSMIGQCMARNETRIALDVGEEAVRFVNPHLPDTRSELALPLRARGQVIGAMSVQSVEEAAFDETDIAVLQTVADQVAVAIDNARLFAEAQAVLEEMENIQRRYLGQAWTEYLQATQETSYETKHPGVPPLDDTVLTQIHQAVAQKGAVALQNTPHTTTPLHPALVTPVALRGTIIGALGIHDDDEGRQWTADEITLINAIAERMAVAADNIRLLDETQRRAEAMRHMYDLSSTLMGVESSRQAMALITSTARQLTRAAIATAYAYNEARGGYERVSAAADADQWDQEAEGEIVSPRPGGLTAYIIQEGAAVSITDTATDERAHPDLAAMGLRSMLGVPIQMPGQKPIGVLFCHGNPVGQFDDEDLRLVTILANRTAASLQSTRLAEEVRTALEETTALYHASRAIGAATSVEKVGQALVDYAATSGVDAARVLLFEHDDASGDGGRNPTYMVMREGWTVDDRSAQLYGSRLPLADYPLADLMTPHEPIIVEDILTDPRANEAARTLVTAISGLRSMIMAPITVGERWIGMLFAGRNEPFTFPEEFVRGYETLTGQAAIALESIRLLKETQQRAERERLIGDVTTRMRKTLDVDTVLQTAVREIGESLGLHDVTIQLENTGGRRQDAAQTSRRRGDLD